MGKLIKCDFCEQTTTQGFGEASGFGHIKGKVGGKVTEIISCSKHSEQASEKFLSFLKGLKIKSVG